MKTSLNKFGANVFDILQRKMETRDVESAEQLGEKLAMVARAVDKKHRLRTDANLALAFPEWSAEKRSEVGMDMYRHFGRIAADFMRTSLHTKEEILATTEVEGWHYLEEAEAAGNGVIAVTGHFGNWERMAHYMHYAGRTLTVIMRDANQNALNDRVVRLREQAGSKILSRGKAARGSLLVLRRNEMLGILSDQNTDEMFVPFFGQPAGTASGPAVFHVRTGAPVIPIYSVWISPGRYRMMIQPPLVAEEGFPPIEGMTRAVNASLEWAIRQYPEQWLWMHDRWKCARQRGLLT